MCHMEALGSLNEKSPATPHSPLSGDGVGRGMSLVSGDEDRKSFPTPSALLSSLEII